MKNPCHTAAQSENNAVTAAHSLHHFVLNTFQGCWLTRGEVHHGLQAHTTHPQLVHGESREVVAHLSQPAPGCASAKANAGQLAHIPSRTHSYFCPSAPKARGPHTRDTAEFRRVHSRVSKIEAPGDRILMKVDWNSLLP
jgi:hypothetical protein